MFAVFHKNEFKGLWMNQKDDQGWIGRTAIAMGWNLSDVVALWFNYSFDARTVYYFDENKNLLIQGPKKIPVAVDGVVQEVDGWGTIETIVGEPFFS